MAAGGAASLHFLSLSLTSCEGKEVSRESVFVSDLKTGVLQIVATEI